jgi:hypothetical protein
VPVLTRRELMRMTPAALLPLGLWPGALAAGEKACQEIRFAVLNDLHVVNRACADRLAGVAKGLKGHRPELVILAGDAEQLTPVRDVFKTLGVPSAP